MRSSTSNEPSGRTRDLVHALELIDNAQPLAHQLHRHASTTARRFPSAKQQAVANDPVRGSPESHPPALLPRRARRQSRSPAPSTATSSKPTFCAMVIITCCSFALGARLTSQTLLFGTLAARFAASYSACAAHGSSTAGSIISFFSAGPFGAVDRLQESAADRARCCRTLQCDIHHSFGSRPRKAESIHGDQFKAECSPPEPARNSMFPCSPSTLWRQFHRHAPQYTHFSRSNAGTSSVATSDRLPGAHLHAQLWIALVHTAGS